jgi:hypothetical protein
MMGLADLRRSYMRHMMSMRPAWALVVVFGLSGQVALAQARAAEKAAGAAAADSKFLRFVEDQDGGGTLQTSIVTYTNKDNVKVHLVGAVHVGETSYYKDLEKTFKNYDALLYEMVKPKGLEPAQPGQRGDSAVSSFQRLLKDVLELDFQLDAIDYTAKNFVHADLDAETFTKMQEERGETMWKLMLRQMLNDLENPKAGQITEADLLQLMVALFSPDRARHMKMMLAKQFNNIEEKMAGMEGPNGSVILGERNKAAVKALRSTIAEGKKDIGIFYGAAHMKGIEEMLVEMGFTQSKIEWRTAWDMTAKDGDIVIKVVKKKPAEAPAEK